MWVSQPTKEQKMEALQTLNAKVTDTNNKARGTMTIKVEFADGAPLTVWHNGQCYLATGKHGTNRKTDLQVVEMATDKDARLWITLDGTQVWED
jgi:hypothetical protein